MHITPALQKAGKYGKKKVSCVEFPAVCGTHFRSPKGESSGFLFSPTFQALLYHCKFFNKNSGPAMDLYLPLIVRTRFKLFNNPKVEWQGGNKVSKKGVI
jgi:hypothetical protein